METEPTRVCLDRLQRPKSDRGIAFPDSWIYYGPAQLQHMVVDMAQIDENEGEAQDSTFLLILHYTHSPALSEGLESQNFGKKLNRYKRLMVLHTIALPGTIFRIRNWLQSHMRRNGQTMISCTSSIYSVEVNFYYSLHCNLNMVYHSPCTFTTRSHGSKLTIWLRSLPNPYFWYDATKACT